jgi:Golgi nucleoside diphosphatase
MFDAGSSGTRVYVYKWKCREQQSTPQVVVTEDIPNMSVRPGISSFANNPENVGKSLDPLLAFALKIVPTNQQSATPVFLRATAGMRLLTIEQQGAILDNIRWTFRESVFRFDDDAWARVVTGTEEGAFGWVAANYLYNKIRSDVFPLDTNAVLDCGGASVQVTFVPPTLPKENKLTISFPDINKYTVYTYSYLGFGQDQAREGVLRAAVRQANASTIYSPCFNAGYNSTKVAAFDPNLRIIGTGDYGECRKQIKATMNITDGCTDCSIGGNYQPKIPDNVVLSAMNSFVFISDFFKLGDSYSINILNASSTPFCAATWGEIQQRYPVDDFLSGRCFSASLMSELATSAFGIDSNRRISAKNKIGNVTVAWTLGCMLYDMSIIPCRIGTEDCVLESPALKIIAIVLPVCASVAILFILCVGAVLLLRNKLLRKHPNPDVYTAM